MTRYSGTKMKSGRSVHRDKGHILANLMCLSVALCYNRANGEHPWYLT